MGQKAPERYHKSCHARAIETQTVVKTYGLQSLHVFHRIAEIFWYDFFRRANDMSYTGVCVDRAAMAKCCSTPPATRFLQCSYNHIFKIGK